MAEHKGMHRHRFKDNPDEEKIAETWEEHYGRNLKYLLSETNDAVPVSDRDALVAATVIQWLGSPVGKSFLREALGVDLNA